MKKAQTRRQLPGRTAAEGPANRDSIGERSRNRGGRAGIRRSKVRSFSQPPVYQLNAVPKVIGFGAVRVLRHFIRGSRIVGYARWMIVDDDPIRLGALDDR